MKTTRKIILQLVALLCVLCISGTAWADVLVIPSGVRIIEEEAFSGTAAGTLVIPESTSSIESRAFASCDGLTDVYLPERAVSIADDAFDSAGSLTFHVYMGSANADWAVDRGYSVAYMTAEDLDYGGWSKVETLVRTEATSTSNSELYYTHRLIVRLNSGFSMPDVTNFRQEGEEDPVIVPLEQDHYVIQFSNPTSARNCAATLNAWEGCQYAEADYFISEVGGTVLQSRSGASDDPMGFGLYTQYLLNKYGSSGLGHVTVAVIDTGVDSSVISCVDTDKSYDFVNGRKASEDGNGHGTNVAQRICSAFGSLVDHLTIISYRVVRPSDSRASYLLVGKAIRRAKDDGANFVNISHVFESPYITEQDNRYLQESISYCGAGKVFAAAGNDAAMSGKSALPAKYCNSVTGAQYSTVDQTTLVRAPGTASGADYAGFDTTTSFATAKLTAAAALCSLDPDPEHTLNGACVAITTDCGRGMPDLSTHAVVRMEEIIPDIPSDITLEVGDRLNIQYAIRPTDATNPNVLAVSSDTSVLTERNHDSNYYRFTAMGPGEANITFTSEDGHATPVIVHVSVVQPPVSITISGNTDQELMKGQKMGLTATVLPDNTTNKGIRWTSSNDGIATVTATGAFTAEVEQVGEGQVTITATSVYDQTVYGTIGPITVVNEYPVDEVIVTSEDDISSITVGKKKETLQMYATVLPEGSNQAVTWSVDNENVATIDQNGLLTAAGDGDVIVKATSVASGKYGYKVITVIQLPTSASLSGGNRVDIGGTLQLTATLTPTNARDKSVVWTSSDPAVATVSASGLVTGIAEGTTVIVATSIADGTVAAYTAVNVTNPVVLPDGVTITPPSSTVLDINGTLVLMATVSPEGATNKTVTWSTSDTSIATINASGVLTAKAPGTVRAIATTHNGKSDSVTLTVRQPYTLNFNANGGSVSTSSRTCYSGYAIGGTLPTPTRTGYTFAGWFTAASGGTQVTTASSFTSSSAVTVYAHWTPIEYTYNIVYESSNGTSLGTDSAKKAFGTTNTITPPAYAGYVTPDAQSVVWDATSKTITFVYSPTPVDFFTKSYQWNSSPVQTFAARVEYQNRTATSVQVRVYWKNTLKSGYTIYKQKFFGTCGGVTIPTTTVVPYNAWGSSSSSARSKEAYSSWITVPLNTTNQTTLSMSIKYHQYNSNDSDVSTNSSVNAKKYEATWTITIPAY